MDTWLTLDEEDEQRAAEQAREERFAAGTAQVFANMKGRR